MDGGTHDAWMMPDGKILWTPSGDKAFETDPKTNEQTLVYDAKKKPTAADFTRVAVRWEAPYQKAPERTLLMPGAGVGVFSSEKVVRPPHSFRLFVTLIKGDGPDAPVENLVVEFRG